MIKGNVFFRQYIAADNDALCVIGWRLNRHLEKQLHMIKNYTKALAKMCEKCAISLKISIEIPNRGFLP
jgi:hypothetical protein